MPESNSRPWQIPDLLDFEFFLDADVDHSAEDLRSRDRAFAGEIGEEVRLRPEAGRESRAEVFRRWLEMRRERLARDQGDGIAFSPGQAFQHSRRLVAVVLNAAAVTAGAGLVWGLLNFEQRFFNVLLFLAVTMLPQTILLVMLIFGWLFRNVIGRSATAGFVQTLVRTAIEWLSAKAWANRLGEKAVAGWKGLRRRNYLSWPIGGATQAAAVFFNVGLLAGFAGCLAVMDVRFFWESTPGIAAAETLKGIVQFLAAPWAWLFSGAVPTMEGIVGTKIEIIGGERGLPEKIESAPVWSAFLSLTIITWGLVPRLGLRLVAAVMERRSVRGFSFNERLHRELWRRLTEESHVEAPIEGPGDDTVVILWGGLSPEPESLRKACLQQLRLDPVETIAAGGIDPSSDEEAVEQVSKQLRDAESLSRVVLLAESWGLVPRDLGPFLSAVRQEIGDELPVIAFLVGHPGKQTPFTVPEAKEIAVWEEFAAELDDPNLTIRPFRSNRVEPASQEG